MAKEWTDAQRLAIDRRDKSLLVSAAAGSGKTATLTQRIIETLLDEQTNISEMLIVTFTRAAVGELRDRISAAIKNRLSERPGDERLERQLFLLPSAKILTIDAFCNDCLKNFPEEAGINLGYRIADAAEILLISKEVFDGVTEAILRGELSDTVTKEGYEELCDCLADSKKMADVFDVFRKIYEKLRTTTRGIGTFSEMTEAYSPARYTTPGNTVFGRYIFEQEIEIFEFRAKLYSDFASALANDGATVGNYVKIASEEAEAFTRVAKTKNYEELRDAVDALSFSNLSMPRGSEKSPIMVAFGEARKKEKEHLEKEKKRFFAYTDEEWRASIEAIYRLMKTFGSVLLLFDAALTDKKKTLGAFDYTDIERLAFDTLVKDGEPTDVARSISEQYRYVYIDEYQDVNDLQDSIFRAVSRENNRFTVGDIKQSIYSFRSANPDIFAEAKRSYPDIKDAHDLPSASIFMSKNFRSSAGIVDFVNAVFDKMFGIFASGIDYKPLDRLEAARKPLGKSYYAAPEICLTPTSEIELTDDGGDEEAENICAAVVAAKIKELIESGTRENEKLVLPEDDPNKKGNDPRIHPGDIAIILRSMKNKSEKYTSALTRLGIPVKTTGKKNFFMNSDVLLALCLLNSINNPLRDVYLTGLLRSPLFGFTADELVMIRGKEKYKPFYKSLCEYTDSHPDFERGKTFIKTLGRWRELAEGTKTDKLISILFREAGLLALASEHGEKENLLRLYEYARSFEGSSFGGLGSFIGYINNVIAEKESFDCNISSSTEDAVTVMSAHSSKGLQKPIVFFADASKKIENKDTSEKFLMSVGFGAALRHRTPRGLGVVDNPIAEAVKERMDEKNFEEELRILYVALTRAEERLYVVGASRELCAEDYYEKLSLISKNLCSRAVARRLSSHFDIITASTGRVPKDAELFVKDSKVAEAIIEKKNSIKAKSENSDGETAERAEDLEEGSEKAKKLDTDADKEPVDTVSDEERAALVELLTQRFDYKYHSPHLTTLPEKMSVSELSPTVLNERNENSSDCQKAEERALPKKTTPEFIHPSKREESKRRGIATHLFLQFCDFKNLKENGAERELERLVKEAFISEKDAPRVRISEIKAFMGSELFERMLGAKKLWREFRFNTPLPAVLFTTDSEKALAYKDKNVLVQGVMDCVIEGHDGSLSIVDYKTDRLTPEELDSPTMAAEHFKNAYRNQLYYYRIAAERIFGKTPERVEIFSLHLGKCVDLT